MFIYINSIGAVVGLTELSLQCFLCDQWLCVFRLIMHRSHEWAGENSKPRAVVRLTVGGIIPGSSTYYTDMY